MKPSIVSSALLLFLLAVAPAGAGPVNQALDSVGGGVLRGGPSAPDHCNDWDDTWEKVDSGSAGLSGMALVTPYTDLTAGLRDRDSTPVTYSAQDAGSLRVQDGIILARPPPGAAVADTDPVIIEVFRGAADEDAIVSNVAFRGANHWTWEIWHCVDRDLNNAAAYFVYRYSARFDSPYGYLHYDNTGPNYSVPEVFYYDCDSAAGGECIAFSKQEAKNWAYDTAHMAPSYASTGTAVLDIIPSGGGMDFEGTFSVSGTPTVAAKTHFDGCNGSHICILADATSSTLIP